MKVKRYLNLFTAIISIGIVIFSLIDYKTKNSNLIKAASDGDAEQVWLLLEKGVNVNSQDKDGKTALMAAAEKGHTNVVKTLLDANPNIHIKGSSGWTALGTATHKRHTGVIKLLTEYKQKD